MYQTEHDELFASIRSGNPINNGHYMTVSTMVAILGRMATYTGKSITWDEAINSRRRPHTGGRLRMGPTGNAPGRRPGSDATGGVRFFPQ
ncbi:MAG: hypothetical protein R3C10_27785 [Pirellulales bacterium]